MSEKGFLRRLVPALLVLLVSLTMAVYFAGGSLSAPWMGSVGAPPPDFPVESVRIAGDDDRSVAGWFASGQADEPGVLLLHGIRSDRRAMLGRARFLHRAGFSVLLIDMQAHGETPGERITFGLRESRDVDLAMRYLRERLPSRKVGVIGVSLGGAAALLGDAPVAADAVVLEAVYSTIERAVENRLSIRFGAAGRMLAPLLTWQIGPRLGIPPDALSPQRAIAALDAPVMIVAGARDRHTSEQETRALYAGASGPKQLWLVQGAAHENLHAFAAAAYEERVLRFFRRHLRQNDG